VKALWLFTFLFLACGTAQSQGLRVLPVQIRGGQGFPAAIQFYCTENYPRSECQNDISLLRRVLARYPMEKVGSWSYILASSAEWEPLTARLRLPLHCPAFSVLAGNKTVFSQALFTSPADRRAELMRSFEVPSDQLLDLAVAHELAHAFCHELSEATASAYGEQLRAGNPPNCRAREGHRSRAGRESSITSFIPDSVLAAPVQTIGVVASPEQPSLREPQMH
jgi:hypothetical protein